MIKNQKQAAVAKERLAELNQSFIELNSKQIEMSLAEYKLGVNSLSYLIDEIKKEINEYDSLAKGDFHCFEPTELGDINKILIAARIAKRMSHRELAELIGIQEQQIQRYESSDYESVNWTRIQEIAFALDLKFEFKRIEINSNKRQFKIPSNVSPESVRKAKIDLKSRGYLNGQAA